MRLILRIVLFLGMVFELSSACPFNGATIKSLSLLPPVPKKTGKGHKPPQAPPSCPKSQIQPSFPEPGHHPWTHPPHCEIVSPAGDKLCVFTDANYHGGQGLSIVARPEVVKTLLGEEGMFLSGRGQYKSKGREEGKVKYEALERPGMGVGLFVKSGQSYEAGEVILVDYPTLMLPAEGFEGADLGVLEGLAWKGLLQLPEGGRGLTRGLARSKKGWGIVDEIVDVVDTNAFAHGKGGAVHNIIFPLAARMNHNCLPNAITRTNHSTLATEVIALRDIPPGSEIVNSYLNPSVESTSRERRHELESAWNFSCRCSICTGPEVPKSDARRRLISAAKQRIEEARGNPAEILKQAQVLIDLFGREGMVIPKADYYELAAMAAKYLGRREEALGFSREAKRCWNIVMGEGSQESKAMVDFEADFDVK